MDTRRELVTCDVLIIGGGAQGLWLLDRLRREGYHPLLIEDKFLRAGQSGHSHAILHSGALYRPDVLGGLPRARAGSLVERLREGYSAWASWLEAEALIRREEAGAASSRIRLGYRNPMAVEKLLPALVDPFGNTTSTEDLPSCLNRDVAELLHVFPDRMLEVRRVLETIRDRCSRHICLIDSISQFETDDGRVQSATVTLRDGRPLEVRPECVVVAAGESTDRVLDRIRWEGEAHGAREACQAEEPCHTLVILAGDGCPSLLESIFAFFPRYKSLLILTRRGGERTAWLVSNISSWNERDLVCWMRSIWRDLGRVAPGIHRDRAAFHYGIYTANRMRPEAKLTDGFERERWGLHNVIVMRPHYLTLVPLAAESAMQQLRSWLGVARGSDPAAVPEGSSVPDPAVGVALERWEQIELIGWDAFRLRYNLPDHPGHDPVACSDRP